MSKKNTCRMNYFKHYTTKKAVFFILSPVFITYRDVYIQLCIDDGGKKGFDPPNDYSKWQHILTKKKRPIIVFFFKDAINRLDLYAEYIAFQMSWFSLTAVISLYRDLHLHVPWTKMSKKGLRSHNSFFVPAMGNK